MEQPPERGDYFRTLASFFNLDSKRDEGKLHARNELVSRLGQRPWVVSDHPRIAAWLVANEKPLALIAEASRRPTYFNPIIPKGTGNATA